MDASHPSSLAWGNKSAAETKATSCTCCDSDCFLILHRGHVGAAENIGPYYDCKMYDRTFQKLPLHIQICFAYSRRRTQNLVCNEIVAHDWHIRRCYLLWFWFIFKHESQLCHLQSHTCDYATHDFLEKTKWNPKRVHWFSWFCWCCCCHEPILTKIPTCEALAQGFMWDMGIAGAFWLWQQQICEQLSWSKCKLPIARDDILKKSSILQWFGVLPLGRNPGFVFWSNQLGWHATPHRSRASPRVSAMPNFDTSSWASLKNDFHTHIQSHQTAQSERFG